MMNHVIEVSVDGKPFARIAVVRRGDDMKFVLKVLGETVGEYTTLDEAFRVLSDFVESYLETLDKLDK